MAEIFLSYAKEDRDVAARLSKLLEQAGWTVWWDRRIPAGRTWRDVLEEALRDMSCMVVLWSSHSIESDWVKEEAEEARLRKKLVPVLIEGVNPPVGFRTIQAADLTDWDGIGESVGSRQLIADLELIIGKPQARATIDAKQTISARQSGAQPGPESATAGVKGAEHSSQRPTRSDSDLRRWHLAGWKVAAGIGVVFVVAFVFVALWRSWTPVTDEVATAVATMPLQSTGEIPPPAPELVKLMVHGARHGLKPNENLPLSVRAQFSDGTEKEFTGAVEWLSSNARVAKVDGAGRITALQSGTTEITATHGGVTSSAWVLAVQSRPSKPAPAPKLVALTVSADRTGLKPQEKIPLRIAGKYSDGSERTLSSGWVLASNNDAVLSVNAQGEAEARRAGNAEVVARYGNMTSAPLRLVVQEPEVKVAIQPRQQKGSENAPAKTPAEVVATKLPDTRPSPPEPSAEELRAKIMGYINRAKNLRARGDYRAAMAELAAARTVDPTSREVGAEIEQTKRACIAERKLGTRSLDC